MAGEKADMVFTDPPYGMDLDTDYSSILGSKNSMAGGIRGKKYDKVIGDDNPFDPAQIFEFWDVKEMFLFGADYYCDKIQDIATGSWFVWDKCVTKDGFVSDGAEKMIGSNFELCWSRHKHKREIARIFHRGMTSADSSDRVHPTQKPIQLAEWFVSRFSKDENIIVDPFIGSGTTMVACQNLNRKCRAIEISPNYCAVILERMHTAFPELEITRMQ